MGFSLSHPSQCGTFSAYQRLTHTLISRQNTVLDFFKQSMIDYVLGINLNAFVEFSEQLRTSDPGEIVRLAAIRKAASACSR